MNSAFPEKLDRLPYFYRWLALLGAAALLFYLILLFAMRTKLEALVLVPSVGWFILKIVFLDPSRLRSIGWSPILSVLSLLPPVAIFLQLLLFFLSPKRT
jgi:hypothetical protein